MHVNAATTRIYPLSLTTLFRSLGVDPSGTTAWTINGRAFDHERVDARPELGSTETWLFVNAGAEARSHRSEEHTSEPQSRLHPVCRLPLEKKKTPAPEPHPS